MNKKMKIITLILSCVLLIGAAVGITVAAEENAPTVKIAGQNISYEGAVKVAYYIPAEGLEGYTVKVLSKVSETFTYGKTVGEKLTYSEDVTVSVATDKVTIEGTEYLIGYSEGIAPKKLRDNVYSVAIVVDENDNVVAVSANKRYSVYTYAMNRFNGESTVDQYGLYTALLNYGAAVQAVLGYNAEAGKWADEYIVVDQLTTTNGTPAETDFAIRGTTLEDPTVYEYVAPRWYGEDKNLIFTGFTGADGESYLGDKYSANWNKISLRPGEHTINKNYATANGVYNTFDYGTTLADNDVVVDANVFDGEDATANKWITINKDGYLAYGKNVSGSGAGIVMMNTADIAHGKVADYYVADFDFYVDNTGNTGTNAHIGQFWINGATHSDTSGGHLWGVNLYGNATTGTFKFEVDGGSDTAVSVMPESIPALAYGEWHNVRVEFYTNLGEFYRQSVNFYVDGLYAGTYTKIYSGNVSATGDGTSSQYVQYAVDYYSVGFNMNNASLKTTFMFDNAYLGIVEKDFVFGQGYYANLYEDQLNDFEDVGNTSSKLGWENISGFGNEPITWAELVGDGSAAKTGYQWTKVEKDAVTGNTTVNVGKVNSYDPEYTTNDLGMTHINGNSPRFVATDSVGDKFVFETDFKLNYTSDKVWDGSAFRGTTDRWFLRLGMVPVGRDWGATGDNGTAHFIFYPDFTNQTVRINSSSGLEVFGINEWVNIRMEYTPTGVNADGKGTYKLELFINGRTAASKTGTSALADNTAFKGVATEGRGYVSNFSMSYDNMFVGAVGTRGDYSVRTSGDAAVIDYDTVNTGYDSGNVPALRNDGTTTNNTWAGVYEENGNKYLQIGKTNATTVTVRYATEGTLGDTYVFSTDFNAISNKGTGNNEKYKTSPWFTKIALFSGVENSDNIYALYAFKDDTNVVITASDRKTELATVPMKQWMNLRLEYTPTGKDGDLYTAHVKAYIDGTLVLEQDVSTAGDNTTYANAYVEVRGYASDAVVGVDNTIVGVQNAVTGNGAYADKAEKYDSLISSSNNLSSAGFAEGKDNVAGLIQGAFGNKYVEIDRTNVSGSGNNVVFNNLASRVSDTYVFETDVNFGDEWAGFTQNTDMWNMKLGFANKDGGVFMPVLVYVVPNADGDKIEKLELKVHGQDTAATLYPDSWYNIRFEYTPKEKSGDNYLADVTVYVDGVAVQTLTDISMDSTYNKDNTTFREVVVELRGYAKETTVRFDNTYVGPKSATVIESTYEDLTFVSGNTSKVTAETVGDETVYHFNVGSGGEQSSYFNDTTDVWKLPRVGTAYSVGFDLTINDFENKSRDWWAMFGLKTNASSTTYDYSVLCFNASVAKSSTALPKIGTVELQKGVTHKVQIVYFVTSIDDAKGLTVGFSAYVDGILATTGSDVLNSANTDIIGFGIKTPGNSTTHGEIITNDFTVGKLAVDVYDFDGLIHTQDFTSDSADAAVVGTRKTDGFNTRSQYVTIKEDVADATNKVLNFHIAKTADPEIEGDTAWHAGELHTYYLADDLGQAKVGSVYEVTYRIRINEIDNNDIKGRSWWMYSGLITNSTASTNFENGAAAYMSHNISGDTLKIGSQVLTVGEWYEVRYVYVVTSLEGGMTFTSTVYVNGVSVGSHHKDYPKSGNGTNVIGFGFKTPSDGGTGETGNGKFDDFDFDIDDISIIASNVTDSQN